MKKFEKAQKGDKVYSLLHGEGVVKNIGTALLVIQFDNSVEEYYLDGKFSTFDNEGVLFWVKPRFSLDVEPKRKVKKTSIKYVNIYPDGNVNMHNSANDAQNKAGIHAVKIAEPVTFEYEVIE